MEPSVYHAVFRQRSLRVGYRSDQSLRDQARLAITNGRSDRAVSLIQSIQQQFPDDFETRALAAQIHLENGRHQQARADFQAVLEVDPENILARSALAIIAEEQGDPREALEHFERAFDVDPSNQQIAIEIKRIRSLLGHGGGLEPGTSLHAAARRFLKEKRYDRAVNAFRNALWQEPVVVEILVGAARALWLSRRFSEAEEMSNRILADHPNCLSALAILAGLAILKGGREFNSYLNRTAALNPGNPVARGIIEGIGIPYPRIGEIIEVPWAVALDESVDADSASGEASPAEPSDTGVANPGAAASPEEGSGQSEWGLDIPAEPPLSGREPTGAGNTEAIAQEHPDEQPPEPEGQEVSGLSRPLEAEVALVGPSGPMGTDISLEQRANARLHLSFGRAFETRGQVELALAEYAAALRSDPTSARAVVQAVGTIVEADPTNLKALWLMGDALVLQGQFRKAVARYLAVLQRGQKVPAADDSSNTTDNM